MSHHLDAPLARQNGRLVDPFYIDLDQLFAINAAVAKGTKADSSKWDPSKAKNSFAGTTVQAIVVEVSHDHPIMRPGTRRPRER